ncbi:GNAT family N-acetyltransferase [Crenobacter sp. SG2303]|uniref:GNAT family N-acetyltransferase n=1 Tax=Crenobacter oryzisoli TaxID=3056844 RepID=A0ABT7XNR4_9NEIS|nr:GNAT family N-acetyltransferase [Crenobacter sp. SG2303]MDN0075204.1 GNAT family N-acetyltransferase [Crenobacter sp. SG2303]
MTSHLPLRIDAVRPADHTAWLVLWRAYQVFYQVDIPESTSAVTWQRLLDPSEPVYGALAWQGDEAVGLVHWVFHRTSWSIGDDCYLQDLFVQPEQRGGGVGRALIEHVYEQADEAGCASVHWLTHETNHTAQQLYNRIAERSGFIQYCQPL